MSITDLQKSLSLTWLWRRISLTWRTHLLFMLVLPCLGPICYAKAPHSGDKNLDAYLLRPIPPESLKDHKNLSKKNVFRFKTESHRLRVPRYIVYLLSNQEFLNRFPDFKKLTPYIDEIIELGNAHDIEKSPEKINTMLTKYNGVDHNNMTKNENAKFKKNIEDMNHSGEVKLNKIFNKLGFSSGGVLDEKARLFLALEGWVDRWDAAMFRGKEFGKTMQRVADYVRAHLIPNGFHAKYDLNLVAEMDDFAYHNPSKVNLLGAVEDIVPDNYQKLRSNFKWRPFSEIQKAYTQKLKTLYKLDSRIKPIRKPKVSPTTSNPVHSAKAKSTGSLVLGRLGETAGLAGTAYLIRGLNDTKTTKTDISNTLGRLSGEGLPSLAARANPVLATGLGLFAYSSTTGDDIADRYMDPEVYADFLKLPLEEQEIRIKGNETSAFKSVIYSQRPQILSLKCPLPNDSLETPFTLNIESLERQPYEIKIGNDKNNDIHDIISASTLPTTSGNDTQIRFNFKSASQVCLNLPLFSDGLFHEKTLCTQLNQKGFPDLEAHVAQHIKPDHWNESVKVREWLRQNPDTVKECCQRTKCREYMANKNNTSPKPDPMIKKPQRASSGFR